MRQSIAPVLFFSCLLAAAACTEYRGFDTAAHLRGLYAQRLDEDAATRAVVPFALDDEISGWLEQHVKPARSETYRVEQVLDFIFRKLRLRYSQTPTRSAVDAYRSREGNCLSFVNLFVGVARHQRLNPFYVEVTDYQRWSYRDGLVVSRGHIVAGLYVEGQLETFDFLPYRTKGYEAFRPIDDLTAAAHHYNNLGAEALMEGNLERARENLEIAVDLAPGFVKALNNLGVVLGRAGDREGALRAYRKGLDVEPGDVPILTNLTRLCQSLGRTEEAEQLMARLGEVENSNPYFFIYRGEMALADGDTDSALEHMRQALRRGTELPDVHVGLAKVFLARGDLARARHHVDRALKLDATDPEARRWAALIGQALPP